MTMTKDDSDNLLLVRRGLVQNVRTGSTAPATSSYPSCSKPKAKLPSSWLSSSSLRGDKTSHLLLVFAQDHDRLRVKHRIFSPFDLDLNT